MAVILPNNGRPRAILNKTEAATTTSIEEVVVENDAISLTYYIDSLSTDTYLTILIEEIGDTSTNTRVLFESPRIAAVTKEPTNLIFIVPGRIRITVFHTGAADFEITGKSMNASAVPDVVQVVTDRQLQDEAESHRSYDMIIQLLTKINNHLRIASGIDDSDTDTF